MLNAAASASGNGGERHAVVCLFDVDNTLFDNDRFKRDLDEKLAADFGDSERDRYWAIYEQRRERTGYADYLGTLEQFRAQARDEDALLAMSAFLLDYDFAAGIYPHATDVLASMAALGTTVLLSDGDIVFQPRKIRCAGLWDMVGGRVLVTVHKQDSLDAMQRRYPATHYVMIDDKPQILADMKRAMGERLTTVFVRQGHYALEAEHQTIEPPPDLCVDRIGDLCTDTLAPLLPTDAIGAAHSSIAPLASSERSQS